MDFKNTDDLKQELMESPDLHEFLSDNNKHFISIPASELLGRLLTRKGISKSTLAKQAGMSEVYLHQIFSGRRNPSRNRLLSMCYGLGATLDETQDLLKHFELAQLFPKVRRDSILIYGLLHNLSLFEINEKLFEEQEDPLL